MPIEKLENGAWLHAGRLPLGCGWSGHCTAPGHEGEIPSQGELQELCNLGYAEGCGRLPKERVWDSVRFGARVVSNGDNSAARVQVQYVCERGHRPAEYGTLEYAVAEGRFVQQHADRRVQRMAECFVAAYVEKKKYQEVNVAAAS